MHGPSRRTTAGSVSWRALESGSCLTAHAMLRSVLVRPGQGRLSRTPEADETCPGGKQPGRAVVTAGPGGFLAHDGGALDEYPCRWQRWQGRGQIRAAALGGMEHGSLAIGGCTAAMAVLVAGRGAPPLDLSVGPRRPEAGDLRTAVRADAASISRA